MNTEQRFSAIVEEFRGKPGVTVPSTEPGQKKKFGSSGLRISGHVFAMLSSDDDFVVKLPRERVDEIVASGKGKRFDPRRNGKVMKEWVVIGEGSLSQWLQIVREAAEFAKSPRG